MAHKKRLSASTYHTAIWSVGTTSPWSTGSTQAPIIRSIQKAPMEPMEQIYSRWKTPLLISKEISDKLGSDGQVYFSPFFLDWNPELALVWGKKQTLLSLMEFRKFFGFPPLVRPIRSVKLWPYSISVTMRLKQTLLYLKHSGILLTHSSSTQPGGPRIPNHGRKWSLRSINYRSANQLSISHSIIDL